MKFEEAIKTTSNPTAFAAAGVVAALDEAGVLLDPDDWQHYETPSPADPIVIGTIVSPLGMASGKQFVSVGRDGSGLWRAAVLSLWHDWQGRQREHCCLEAVEPTPAELVSAIRRLFEGTKQPDND